MKEVSIPKGFNFSLTASCYSFPWEFDGKVLKIFVNEKLFKVKEEKNTLSIFCNKDMEEEDTLRIKEVLGMEEDLSEFYSLCRGDPLLDCVPKHFLGLHIRKHTLWEALLIGICQQNASFSQGWKMAKRLWLLFGKKEEDFVFPPSPSSILKGKNMLKEAGVGYRSATFVNLCNAALNGELEKTEKLKEKEARERLCRIKGVGNYTASLALLFSKRVYSLFFIDRWFEKILAATYKRGILEAREKWGKWWGLFCFFTTVATEALAAKKVLEKLKEKKIFPSFEAPYPTPLNFYKF